MSLSGMFNTGHDIGGFAGPVPDPELLTRWVQAGVFSPRFIMNSWKADNTTNTPWLHPSALPAIRDAIRLRYRLMPYLYSIYREAAVDGRPMLRPLFYAFEDDARAFDDTDAFMLGPALLAVPVVEPGQRRVRAYLPRAAGGWIDFWTGERYAGGRDVDLDAPLARVPLLARAGAIVPATDTTDFSRLHDEASRQLRIFPATSAMTTRFALYEDDGATLRYAAGDFATIAIELATTPHTIALTARKLGRYALPYERVRVVLPKGEAREVALRGEGIKLTL
jgi:alpha-glucosidase